MGRIGVTELIIVLVISLIIPVSVCILCYRLGLRKGKRLGFQEAMRK